MSKPETCRTLLSSTLAALLVTFSAVTAAGNPGPHTGPGVFYSPQQLAYNGPHRPHYRHQQQQQQQQQETDREKADFMRLEEKTDDDQETSGKMRRPSGNYRYPPRNLRGR